MILDKLINHVRPGDVMTHTCCGGGIREHFFIGMDGERICGHPTTDTMLIEGSNPEVDDIFPANITHINRIAVDALAFVQIQANRPYAKIGESF